MINCNLAIPLPGGYFAVDMYQIAKFYAALLKNLSFRERCCVIPKVVRPYDAFHATCPIIYHKSHSATALLATNNHSLNCHFFNRSAIEGIERIVALL
mmetsp:Transcript_66078/g.117383  ORF Transcript_66078/g.117383 Transcript_66078/m.117383 type:complete len:98 (+) Transcript_66078:210-503(+)